MAEEFRSEAIFIGVSNNDTVADGKRYRDEFEVPYALAHAPEVWELFDQPFRPTTIVLGPDLRIEHRVDGPITLEGLRAVLEEETSRTE